MNYPVTSIPASNRTYSQYRDGKKIEYIVIHYTGTTASARNNCMYFQGGNRGSSAHYFLDGSGVIYSSVKDRHTAWAVGNFDMNQRSLSIEVVSDGSDFTDQEIQELTWLVKTLMRGYSVPAKNVIRHHDVAKYVTTGKTTDPYKLCPFPYINEEKWKRLHAQITGTTNTKENTMTTDKIYKSTPVDGIAGFDTINALAQIFEVEKRGKITGQPEKNKGRLSGFTRVYFEESEQPDPLVVAIQKTIGVVADGVFGAQTISKWQAFIHTTTDGYFGKQTVKATQRWINQMLKQEKTLYEFLGMEIEPVEWLTKHQTDGYYLNTKYKGCHHYGNSTANRKPYLTCYPNGERERAMLIPRDDLKKYTPGMNCAGFIAHVLFVCGGDVRKFFQIATGWYSNLYNILETIKRSNVKYYVYGNKRALLMSGKAQKGDIIILEPYSYDGGKNDGHIGFFWGEDGSDDKFWHSGSPNKRSAITVQHGYECRYYLVKTQK